MDTTKATPEELAAEQAQLALPKEEEVRENVISEFGFDAEADKERIDKLVAKEIENRKNLSQAIGQKVKWRTEAQKKETSTPPVPEKKETENERGLNTKDFYALTKANVPEEDIDEVLEFAKFKGVSVADALKSPIVKATLSEKEEMRKTAQATTTRPTRQVNMKPSGSEVLVRAKTKGEEGIPDSGTEDADALFKARFEARTGRAYPSK